MMRNYFKKIKYSFSSNFFRNNSNCSPDFELVGTWKSSQGKQLIVAKVVNSFGKHFKLSANELVLHRKDLLSKFSIEDIINIIGIATVEKEPLVTQIKCTSFKFFALLAMLYGSALITSNVASSKLINFFGMTMTGGTIPYLCTYVLGDIITEVYGYKRTRQLIWGAMFCNLFTIFFVFCAIKLPSSSLWHNQSEYELILGSTSRIIIASLISYWISEFLNSYTLAKLKILLKGRYLGMRILLSSSVSVIIDTFLFILMAYAGYLSIKDIMSLFYVSYIVSFIWEFCTIPFSIIIINYLKKKETSDIYDVKTNFTPFSFDVSY